MFTANLFLPQRHKDTKPDSPDTQDKYFLWIIFFFAPVGVVTNSFAIYQSFQYQNPEVEIQYHYEGNSMLPYKQTKRTTRNGNIIMELENYTWEFFE